MGSLGTNDQNAIVQIIIKKSRTSFRPTETHYSPVNLWFDLDKIATETLFVGNYSHTHPEQHIKNIEQCK